MPIEVTTRSVGKRFRARFNVGHSTFRSPWFPNQKEAQLWEAKTRVELSEKRQATGSSITVASLAKIWLEKHAFVNKEVSASARDEQFLRIHFLPKLGLLKLRNVTARDISFHFADLQAAKHLSPKSINNGLGTIKKMFSDAVEWGYLSHSPASHVHRIKMTQQEVSIFERSEVAALLEFAEKHRPCEYEMIVFALNTGCRLGECLGLSWERVDLENGYVTIDTIWDRATKSFARRTKGKRFRKIPINSDSIALLKRMSLRRAASDQGKVFSAAFKDGHCNRLMRMIMKGAKLQSAIERGVTFHSIRHTFASEFMRRGGTLYQLQQILGHSTITQTEKYAHFAPEHLAGITERVSFGFKTAEVVQFKLPEKLPVSARRSCNSM